MRWILTLALALAVASPAAAELDVPNYEKQISKKEKEIKKLTRKDPEAAATAEQELEQLRRDSAVGLAQFGQRALDEEHDLELAEELLERGSEIVQVDDLVALATRIAEIREDVIARHADGTHTYERLAEDKDTQSQKGAWFRLFEEYRYLVLWNEVDKKITKVHAKIGKKVFSLLVAQGDEDMEAEEYRQAMERYEAAAEIKPRKKDLLAKLQTARDYHRANELGIEAKALLDADKRNYDEAISLYHQALSLHSGYAPLVDGLDLANQRGIEVLMEDAAATYGKKQFIESLRILVRAKALSTTHQPTNEALAEMDGNYRETAGTRLMARGDQYAADGYHAQAYAEYELADAVSSRVDVDQRLRDAHAAAMELVPYEMVIAAPSNGGHTGWGSIGMAFSMSLNQRLDASLNESRYHANVEFLELYDTDAAVTGEYSAFDVARGRQTETRTKSYVARRYMVPNPSYSTALAYEEEKRLEMNEAWDRYQAWKADAAADEAACLANPPADGYPRSDPMDPCYGLDGVDICYCQGRQYSSSDYDTAKSRYDSAVSDRENTPSEIEEEEIREHSYDVIWYTAQLTANLEILIYQALTGLNWTRTLSYSNSYKDYSVAEQVMGVDQTVLEYGHEASMPSNDTCVYEMVGALADQARDTVLGHLQTHGDRWKVHFEQQHANWQTAHGAQDIVMVLLSDPAHSSEARIWAEHELERRTGLQWTGKTANLEFIPKLMD